MVVTSTAFDRHPANTVGATPAGVTVDAHLVNLGVSSASPTFARFRRTSARY
jgi:hypothetical protein